MYVYHLVDIFTGERLEPLTPSPTPAWARRPEPVAWSVTFHVRPDPRESLHGLIESNPMAGLQHRVRPWRDVIVVSWLSAGIETALAAGIVTSPLAVDEAAGTLTVETVCVRTALEDRQLLSKTYWPPTRHKVGVAGLSPAGAASAIVRIATTNYAPVQTYPMIGGFSLPIDRPEETTGTYTQEWYGYQFKVAGEALEDLEEETGLVVDFVPRWATATTLRWRMEVFSDRERSGDVLPLGSTNGRTPQASYTGTKIDQSSLATVTHHTGKGSEVDVLYTRESDTSPTVMAREMLLARPDVETSLHLVRQARGAYLEHRKAKIQDQVDFRVDGTNPDWWAPPALVMGSTIQVTVENTLTYGSMVLERTLIGWKASGPNTIDLELQDLSVDSGA